MIRRARTAGESADGPKVVCEIGSDKLGGVYHWAKCLPSVRHVFACEVRGAPCKDAFERAFPSVRFLWVERSSQDPEAVEAVRRRLRSISTIEGGSVGIDALFVDGCKLSFLVDFHNFLPMMSPLGVVFFHDVADEWDGPCPARDFELACREGGFRNERIVDVGDWREAADRERAGIPPSCPHEAWLRHWRGRSCGVGMLWMEGGRRPRTGSHRGRQGSHERLTTREGEVRS